jgi:hypothetical protein
LTSSACQPTAQVATRLGSSVDGLSRAEAARRLGEVGPDTVRDHRARAWGVLGRQLNSPLLLLLAATAIVSFFLAERTDGSSSAPSWPPASGSGSPTSTGPNAPPRRCTPASTTPSSPCATETRPSQHR